MSSGMFIRMWFSSYSSVWLLVVFVKGIGIDGFCYKWFEVFYRFLFWGV